MQGRRLELSHLKGSTMKRLSAPGSGDHGAPDTVMKSTNPSPRALASHGLSSRATVWVHLIHQLWAAPLWKISQSVVAFLWHATKVIIRHSTVFSFSLNYPESFFVAWNQKPVRDATPLSIIESWEFPCILCISLSMLHPIPSKTKTVLEILNTRITKKEKDKKNSSQYQGS